MLPHTLGIDESISEASRECHLAFYRMDESGLDDHARRWVAKIKDLMEKSQTRSLSANEQLDLSRDVDELAHWFEWKSHENSTE